MEKHYTVDEIAEMWNMHRDTVKRLFTKEPGVLVIRMGNKQAHSRMRIPHSVMERVHLRNSTA